jgi:Ni/Co efflux regulator RcnB
MTNRLRLGSALLLSLMLASTSVMADGRKFGRDDDRGRSHGYSQREYRDDGYRRDDRYRRDDGDRKFRDRRYDRDERDYHSRRDDHGDRWDDRAHYYYGARHYHRGDRLPVRYRERIYVVDDWSHRHLYRPPYGHVWVRVDGDYVLMAIATGIIASIILNN